MWKIEPLPRVDSTQILRCRGLRYLLAQSLSRRELVQFDVWQSLPLSSTCGKFLRWGMCS